VLGGVCAGVGRSAGLDPLLLRVAVVAVTVLTGGAGLLAYLAAWALIPSEPVDAAPPAADPPGPPVTGAGSRAGTTASDAGSGAPDPPAADAADAADAVAAPPAGAVPAPRPPPAPGAEAPGDGAERGARPQAPVAGQEPPTSCASS
jgi:phage shock protein PspC (stress-responsive transcriptional regulator)